MRAIRGPAVLPALLFALLAGCAPPPLVKQTRLTATGIPGDTSVGVMVLHHERCAEHRKKADDNCAPAEITERINRRYARCVASGFRDSSHEIAILPGEMIHRKYLAAAEPDYADLTPDRALELLQVPETAAALLRDKVSYVALLSATTTDDNRQPVREKSQGGMLVGAESRRTTVIDAAVYGTRSAARAGDLQLQIEGDAGWMVPMVMYVIPLPPIPYGSRTQTKACQAMGKAIAGFLEEMATHPYLQ